MADLEYSPGPKGQDDKKLFDWARALHREGLDRRRHWEGIWWENMAVYMSDFWAEWDIHLRRLREPVKPPDHRVRIPINLAQPAVRTELAKLTKNRPILDVMARSPDQSDLNSAKVGDKILNNYAERQFNMPRVRRRMLHWVLMCGLGGVLVDWDETALGTVDVLCDAGGNPIFDPRAIEEYKAQLEQQDMKPNYKKIPQGELVVEQVSPFESMFDFSVNYCEDGWWCMVSKVRDVDEIYRRYGKKVEGESDVVPGVIERRMLGRFDLTGKLAPMGPSQSVQKMATVHQLWVKPGHPKFPDGLCFEFTSKTILDKRAYNYGHSDLPLHMMGHIPFPIGQFPMSILQHVKGPVIELSKTESQIIENRNLIANPIWAIPKQLQIEGGRIQNKPGGRITYTYIPNVPEPKPVTMPEMPQYVMSLIEILKEHVLEISGQGETSQGKVPAGARSGVSIAYLQEEDDTRIGTTVQEFEELTEAVGYQMLSIMAEKYTTARTVRIYKKHGDDEVFDFIGTMLDGAAGVVCQAGSALPRSKAAKQQYILDLWDRKLEQDPRRVREMLELSEGEPDEWEVDLDQAERENHQLSDMEEPDPGVKEWYNHPAHHYVHRNFMKSADYFALPEEIQEKFEKHDQEHTMYEEMQAQQAAAQQQQQQQQQPQPGGGGQQSSQNGASAGANGQNVPEGPPSQFTSATSPRTLMDAQPQ